MSDRLEILVIDDDAFVRRALEHLVKNTYPDAAITEAASLDEAIGLIDQTDWSLVILDLSLGTKSGLTLMHQVRMLNLKIPILVLSSSRSEEAAVAAFKAGAKGFLCKDHATSGDSLEVAINKILAGGRYVSESVAGRLIDSISSSPASEEPTLSAQEHRVLFFLARGNAIKEIAHLMTINEKTVRTYRARLLEKLGLSSDAEVVRYAIQNGLID